MSRPVSPYDRKESFLERHLGLAIVLSVGLHILVGWLFLMVLPDLLEEEKEQYSRPGIKQDEKLSYEPVDLIPDLPPRVSPLPPDDPVQTEPPEQDSVPPTTPDGPATPPSTPQSSNETMASSENAISLEPQDKKDESKGKKDPKTSPENKAEKKDNTKSDGAATQDKKPEPKSDVAAENDKEIARRIAALENKRQEQSDDGGGAAADGVPADPQILAYYGRIKAIIESNWILPPGRHLINHDLIYELVIQPGGQISRVRLRTGSGSRDVDISVERAINKSNPLPPLPEVFQNKTQELAIGFDQATVKRRLQQ